MDQVTLAKNQMRAENWRTLIQACRQSGQTVVNWCEQNNINSKTVGTLLLSAYSESVNPGNFTRSFFVQSY